MTERGILIAGGYGVVGQRISAELAPDYQVIVAGCHLERPNAIETSLLLSARDATGPASFDYFLKELTMPFEVHVDGADRPAHAFSDPRVIEFPSPFGPRSAYLFPFSDQVLYPRTTDAQTALTRLAMEPARLATLLAASVHVGAVRLVAMQRVRHALATDCRLRKNPRPNDRRRPLARGESNVRNTERPASPSTATE